MDKSDFFKHAQSIDIFRLVGDVLVYETEIENGQLSIKIVYCDIFNVPVIYFLAFENDRLLSCDESWKQILNEKDSFVGALSFEQAKGLTFGSRSSLGTFQPFF